MGIKEMDACDSSVSGAEKRLDVAVWFGVSLLASNLFKQLENFGQSCTAVINFCIAFGSGKKKRAAGF